MTAPIRPPSPAKPAGGAGAGLLALGVFALGVLRYATEIDAPWDDSAASIVGAEITGNIERSFRRAGYEELKGLPYLHAAPTTVRTAFDETYFARPPLFRGFVHGATRAFGFTEAGLRLPPILCTALAAALLSLMLARRFGVGPAAAAGAFLLANPMSWHFGWMAGFEAPLLALFVLGVLLHAALRRRHVVFYAPVYATFLAAAQVDWSGHLLLPALWVYELCRPKEERRMARTFALLPLGVASFAAVVAHAAWGLDRPFGEALRVVVDAATAGADGNPFSAFDPRPFTWDAWATRQGQVWLGYWTAGGAAVAVAGLLLFAWRRATKADEPTALAFALLAPAVFGVLIRRGDSFVNDYAWFSALPFVACSVAAFVRLLARFPIVAAALVVALVGVSAWRTHEIRVSQHAAVAVDPKALGAELNRIAGPDDALMTQADLGRAAFYVDAWLTTPMKPPHFTPEALVPIAAELAKNGALRTKRVVCLLADRAPGAGSQKAMIDSLGAHAAIRRVPSEELAAESPLISKLLGGSGLAILTIERGH